jgi:polysaccharide biosynthesis/export protein
MKRKLEHFPWHSIFAISWLVTSVAAAADQKTATPPGPQALSDSATHDKSANTLPSYVLGADDQITIRAVNLEEIGDKPIAVGTDGYISLPLLGRVKAAGLTVEQLEIELKTRLQRFIHQPDLSVTITEFRSQPVSVIGYVKNPGILQLQGRKNLVEILSMAGGLVPDAGYAATITRQADKGPIPLKTCVWDPTQKYYIAQVNVKNVMRGLNPENNILVLPNDIISIPKADVVYVLGEVKKNGGFILNEYESLSVLEAVSLAEGLLKSASPNSAKILRGEPGTPSRTEIPVDIKAIMAGKAANVPLEPFDILYVPTSFLKSFGLKSMLSAAQVAAYVSYYAH